MSCKLLEALKHWVNAGRRCVDITISTQILSETKVWCYDFDLEAGKIVTNIGEIPTTKELKEDKRKSLEATLSEL